MSIRLTTLFHPWQVRTLGLTACLAKCSFEYFRVLQSSADLVPEICCYSFDKFLLKSALVLPQQLVIHIPRKDRPRHTTGPGEVITWPLPFPPRVLLLVLAMAVPLSLGCFTDYASYLSQMRAMPCPYQARHVG